MLNHKFGYMNNKSLVLKQRMILGGLFAFISFSLVYYFFSFYMPNPDTELLWRWSMIIFGMILTATLSIATSENAEIAVVIDPFRRNRKDIPRIDALTQCELLYLGRHRLPPHVDVLLGELLPDSRRPVFGVEIPAKAPNRIDGNHNCGQRNAETQNPPEGVLQRTAHIVDMNREIQAID